MVAKVCRVWMIGLHSRPAAFNAPERAFVAQVSNPFVCAGGLVTIFAGSSAFKPAGIHVLTSAKEIAEQGNLGYRRRMVINDPV
jgi:hypothetical protein